MAKVHKSSVGASAEQDVDVRNVPADIDSHYDMDSALGFLFRRLNSLSTAIFSDLSGNTDVTPLQMGILVKVHQAGLISLRALAGVMHVDKSTLQEVVNRMVKRNMLSRRVPELDKRTHELWLGPEGLRRLRAHRGAMERVQDRLLEGISSDDAAVTLRTLKAILERHDY